MTTTGGTAMASLDPPNDELLFFIFGQRGARQGVRERTPLQDMAMEYLLAYDRSSKLPVDLTKSIKAQHQVQLVAIDTTVTPPVPYIYVRDPKKNSQERSVQVSNKRKGYYKLTTQYMEAANDIIIAEPAKQVQDNVSSVPKQVIGVGAPGATKFLPLSLLKKGSAFAGSAAGTNAIVREYAFQANADLFGVGSHPTLFDKFRTEYAGDCPNVGASQNTDLFDTAWTKTKGQAPVFEAVSVGMVAPLSTGNKATDYMIPYALYSPSVFKDNPSGADNPTMHGPVGVDPTAPFLSVNSTRLLYKAKNIAMSDGQIDPVMDSNGFYAKATSLSAPSLSFVAGMPVYDKDVDFLNALNFYDERVTKAAASGLFTAPVRFGEGKKGVQSASMLVNAINTAAVGKLTGAEKNETITLQKDTLAFSAYQDGNFIPEGFVGVRILPDIGGAADGSYNDSLICAKWSGTRWEAALGAHQFPASGGVPGHCSMLVTGDRLGDAAKNAKNAELVDMLMANIVCPPNADESNAEQLGMWVHVAALHSKKIDEFKIAEAIASKPAAWERKTEAAAKSISSIRSEIDVQLLQPASEEVNSKLQELQASLKVATKEMSDAKNEFDAVKLSLDGDKPKQREFLQEYYSQIANSPGVPISANMIANRTQIKKDVKADTENAVQVLQRAQEMIAMLSETVRPPVVVKLSMGSAVQEALPVSTVPMPAMPIDSVTVQVNLVKKAGHSTTLELGKAGSVALVGDTGKIKVDMIMVKMGNDANSDEFYDNKVQKATPVVGMVGSDNGVRLVLKNGTAGDPARLKKFWMDKEWFNGDPVPPLNATNVIKVQFMEAPPILYFAETVNVSSSRRSYMKSDDTEAMKSWAAIRASLKNTVEALVPYRNDPKQNVLDNTAYWTDIRDDRKNASLNLGYSLATSWLYMEPGTEHAPDSGLIANAPDLSKAVPYDNAALIHTLAECLMNAPAERYKLDSFQNPTPATAVECRFAVSTFQAEDGFFAAEADISNPKKFVQDKFLVNASGSSPAYQELKSKDITYVNRYGATITGLQDLPGGQTVELTYNVPKYAIQATRTAVRTINTQNGTYVVEGSELPGADGATEYGEQFDRWHPCMGSKGNVTGGAWDRCITATYELEPGTYAAGAPPVWTATADPLIPLPPGKTTVIPHDKTVTISFQDDTVYQKIETHFKTKTHLRLKVTEKTYFTPNTSPSHWALVPGAQHKRVDWEDTQRKTQWSAMVQTDPATFRISGYPQHQQNYILDEWMPQFVENNKNLKQSEIVRMWYGSMLDPGDTDLCDFLTGPDAEAILARGTFHAQGPMILGALERDSYFSWPLHPLPLGDANPNANVVNDRVDAPLRYWKKCGKNIENQLWEATMPLPPPT